MAGLAALVLVTKSLGLGDMGGRILGLGFVSVGIVTCCRCNVSTREMRYSGAHCPGRDSTGAFEIAWSQLLQPKVMRIKPNNYPQRCVLPNAAFLNGFLSRESLHVRPVRLLIVPISLFIALALETLPVLRLPWLPEKGHLTDIFYHKLLTTWLAQIKLESTLKDFQQHLETNLGDGRIVSPFAQLISDEGMLCSKDFVKRELHPGLM